MAVWMRAALAIGLAALSAAKADAVDLPPIPELPPADAGQKFGGFYLRGDVGVGFEPATALTVEAGPGTAGLLLPTMMQGFGRASLTPSATGDLGLGYRVNEWVRLDATLEYRGGARLASTSALNGTSSSAFPWRYASVRGDVAAAVGLLNAYVDLPGFWGVTPFVGAGAGFSVNTLSGVSTRGVYETLWPAGGAFASGSQTHFAWALMAGVDYEIAPGVALELSYRRLTLGAAPTGGFACLPGGSASAVPCGAGALVSRHGLVANDIRVGLLWTVGPAARD